MVAGTSGFSSASEKKNNLVVLGIPYKSNEQASFDLHLAEKSESQFEQLLGCEYQYSFVIKSWKGSKTPCFVQSA